VKEFQPFACKELVTLNPRVLVQALCLQLATIGIVVGAPLPSYRAGTPLLRITSEGPARFLLSPPENRAVKGGSLANTYVGYYPDSPSCRED
jgi:hypothetical protein